VRTALPPVVLHQEALFGHNKHHESPASNILQISNSSTVLVGDLQGSSASQNAKVWDIRGFIVRKSTSVCVIRVTFTPVDSPEEILSFSLALFAKTGT